MDDLDRQILALEKRAYRYAGAKVEAIHSELGLTPGRYFQLLNHLMDDPEALLAEPVLVRRLQRIRGARVRTKGHGQPA